jgi:thiosulfate/3-mercaptopyruvate sulfurtransferase
MSTSTYAHPEALVSTDWVAQHQNDPKVKAVEVDVEPAKGYDVGHVPGAIGWNWQTDLCDTTIRDLIDPKAFAQLASNAGIKPDDTVVFYGDMNNWFAAWAFWQFKLSRPQGRPPHERRRKKWEADKRHTRRTSRRSRRVTIPSHPATSPCAATATKCSKRSAQEHQPRRRPLAR